MNNIQISRNLFLKSNMFFSGVVALLSFLHLTRKSVFFVHVASCYC